MSIRISTYGDWWECTEICKYVNRMCLCVKCIYTFTDFLHLQTCLHIYILFLWTVSKQYVNMQIVSLSRFFYVIPNLNTIANAEIPISSHLPVYKSATQSLITQSVRPLTYAVLVALTLHVHLESVFEYMYKFVRKCVISYWNQMLFIFLPYICLISSKSHEKTKTYMSCMESQMWC